jgi:glycosyltransferase involved in cell wall biosynthesis
MLLFGIYILSESPAVFAVNDCFVPRLVSHLPPGFSPHLLIFPAWSKESLFQSAKSRWQLRSARPLQTQWMCTTPAEARSLRRVGHHATVCHQNLFCDEDIFTVSDGERSYDAVYNAVLVAYKRHALASQIPKLRLITASIQKLALLREMGLGHAVVNDSYLTKEQVNKSLAECKCGLALSATEGGMLAVTEYLLAGLPLVSTPSRGGRDAWFNRDNHVICDPNPESVSLSVQRWVNEGCDRQRIRSQALELSHQYRSELASTVCSITGSKPFCAAHIAGRWFVQNFVAIHFLQEFLKSYDGHRFARNDLRGQFA